MPIFWNESRPRSSASEQMRGRRGAAGPAMSHAGRTGRMPGGSRRLGREPRAALPPPPRGDRGGDHDRLARAERRAQPESESEPAERRARPSRTGIQLPLNLKNGLEPPPPPCTHARPSPEACHVLLGDLRAPWELARTPNLPARRHDNRNLGSFAPPCITPPRASKLSLKLLLHARLPPSLIRWRSRS